MICSPLSIHTEIHYSLFPSTIYYPIECADKRILGYAHMQTCTKTYILLSYSYSLVLSFPYLPLLRFHFPHWLAVWMANPSWISGGYHHGDGALPHVYRSSCWRGTQPEVVHFHHHLSSALWDNTEMRLMDGQEKMGKAWRSKWWKYIKKLVQETDWRHIYIYTRWYNVEWAQAGEVTVGENMRWESCW